MSNVYKKARKLAPKKSYIHKGVTYCECGEHEYVFLSFACKGADAKAEYIAKKLTDEFRVVCDVAIDDEGYYAEVVAFETCD